MRPLQIMRISFCAEFFCLPVVHHCFCRIVGMIYSMMKGYSTIERGQFMIWTP